MASRLSFDGMTRNWHSSLRRTVCVIGLLLVAQLAHAGEFCFPDPGLEAPALRAASENVCLDASAAPDACIASPQRTAVPAATVALLSPEPLPVAAEAENAESIFRAIADPRSPIRIAPVPPSPAYILYRRFLS